MSALSDIVVPSWARWAALIALVAGAYGLGRLQEARHDSGVHEAAAAKQAAQVVTVVKHEVQTVTQVQTVYQDRVQKIYVQEKQLEADIPKYIPPDVDRDFAIPVGFLRVAGAGWSGAAPGPADDADRQPSSVPFSELATDEISNAASCRAWREQALGWRAFYAGQQLNINGAAGAWYKPEAGDGAERGSGGTH